MGPPFDKLSEYQRECLRRVYRHQTSKEIALHYGVSRHAIDQAIERAARTLNVTGRREAARALAEHEHEHASERFGREPRDLPAFPSLPQSGLAVGQTDDDVDEGRIGLTDQPSINPPGTMPWPLRRKGVRDNDLSIGGRAAWLLVLPVLLAVGFGALTNGLKVLADTVLVIVHTR